MAFQPDKLNAATKMEETALGCSTKDTRFWGWAAQIGRAIQGLFFYRFLYVLSLRVSQYLVPLRCMRAKSRWHVHDWRQGSVCVLTDWKNIKNLSKKAPARTSKRSVSSQCEDTRSLGICYMLCTFKDRGSPSRNNSHTYPPSRYASSTSDSSQS